MAADTVHVLMTGGGAPGAAGILKCLKKELDWKITVADANEQAVGHWLHDDFETIPVAIAPLFIDSIVALCKRKGINIILPLVTKELIPFATHKETFEQLGIKVLVSQLASLEIANNKSRLYEFLDWRGIPVPSFRIVETVEQFEAGAKELGYPEQILCFKPSVSNGSRGFRILSEKINGHDQLFNQKPSSTFMTIKEATTILSSGPFPELLLSTYLPGEEYSVDCLANQGETVLAVPRLRSKMINGISVEGIIVSDEHIISYCKEIIRALQLHGNIGIQVKRSAEGKCLILEINPRVQGAISVCLGAGVNMPVLAIKQELGIPIMEDEMKVKWGTRFVRYWEDVFYT